VTDAFSSHHNQPIYYLHQLNFVRIISDVTMNNFGFQSILI